MKRYLFIALFITVCGFARAQHNDFQSLYMYDALTVNPAYAGNKGALVLNANYRDQWAGLKGSPKTFSFTSHLLTKSRKVGLGLVVMNDQFGIQNNLKINAVYAYKIKLRKNELSLGLAGGIRNQGVNLDELNLHAQDDAAFLGQPQRSIVPDFSFGALFKNDHFLAGFTVPNIVRINDRYTQQAANGYVSVLFGLGRQFKLKPSALVKYALHSPLAYEGNLTVYYRSLLSFGAGMRNDQAVNLHLRVQLNRQFALAYLYERTIGPFSRFLTNTHEFMLNYTLDYQTNVQSPRYL